MLVLSTLISCLFIVLLRIYNDGRVITADKSQDYAADISHMLAYDDPKELEMMRCFVVIHRLLFHVKFLYFLCNLFIL